MNEKWLFRNLKIVLLLTLVIGFLLVLLVEFLMTPNSLLSDSDAFISSNYLEDLANYFVPASVLISLLTTVLLYANFRQQQIEFSRINDNSLLFYEKKKFSEMVSNFNNKLMSHEGKSLEEISDNLSGKISMINSPTSLFKMLNDNERNTQYYYNLLFSKYLDYSEKSYDMIIDFLFDVDLRLEVLSSVITNKESLDLLYFDFPRSFLDFILTSAIGYDAKEFKTRLEEYEQVHRINPKDKNHIKKGNLLLLAFQKSTLLGIVKRVQSKNAFTSRQNTTH